jgi:hypothetical protein
MMESHNVLKTCVNTCAGSSIFPSPPPLFPRAHSAGTPWPEFIRAIFRSGHADQVKRLQLMGFVFGNGGNLATLMNFLQMRGMLTPDSGAWEHLVPIQADLLQPEYQREHNYE